MHQGRARRSQGEWGALGNPSNIALAGALGRNVQAAAADNLMLSVMLLIDVLRHGGADRLEALACGLNRQGIRTPRGKRWYASSRNLA